MLQIEPGGVAQPVLQVGSTHSPLAQVCAPTQVVVTQVRLVSQTEAWLPAHIVWPGVQAGAATQVVPGRLQTWDEAQAAGKLQSVQPLINCRHC